MRPNLSPGTVIVGGGLILWGTVLSFALQQWVTLGVFLCFAALLVWAIDRDVNKTDE